MPELRAGAPLEEFAEEYRSERERVRICRRLPLCFSLHAKRAHEFDPVARLRRGDGGDQLSLVVPSSVTIAPQESKRRESNSLKEFRARVRAFFNIFKAF